MDLRSKMMLAAVEFKEGIQSFELMQDKQHETTSLLVKNKSIWNIPLTNQVLDPYHKFWSKFFLVQFKYKS